VERIVICGVFDGEEIYQRTFENEEKRSEFLSYIKGLLRMRRREVSF
jgi:hypothetical protein